MCARFGRRSVLALAASGALAAVLPGCSSETNDAEDVKDEPYELLDYGYDPAVPESTVEETPRRITHVPSEASVKAEWLPPVGRQTMPNCFVWASVYGLATFHAARKTRTPPTDPSRQAGPDYAYIRYQMTQRIAENTCQGGQIGKCLNWLRSNGGTPSLAAAPNHTKRETTPSCGVNWTSYGSQPIPPDPSFLVPEHKTMRISGPEGLGNLRTVIASGLPIAFGTYLYTDFPRYRAGPSPYTGNGQWMHNDDGRKVGHVMLIVGYDDAFSGNTGAVRVQNSFGKRWGKGGFVWIAYDTLESMAQGQGVYLPDPA